MHVNNPAVDASGYVPSMDYEEIQKVLVDGVLRLHAEGLTYPAIAKKIGGGVTSQTVSNWAYGFANIPAQRIPAVAKALRLELRLVAHDRDAAPDVIPPHFTATEREKLAALIHRLGLAANSDPLNIRVARIR